VSATRSETRRDEAMSTPGTAVFGVPLGKAIAAGGEIPEVLEHCL
jgi:hypothetical protein